MNFDLDILMIGAPRAGKTSILADVHALSSKALAGNATITTDTTSCGLLNIAFETMRRYINDLKDRPHQFKSPDDYATAKEERPDYTFTLEKIIKNKEKHYSTGINLHFKDRAGEHYKDEKDSILEDIRNSALLMIAIDTPYLMENPGNSGYGRRHDSRNLSFQVTSLLSKALQGDDTSRIVMFVPVKCERYYWDNRLDEIKNYVEKGYDDLFQFLRMKKNCKTIIAPILTMNALEFDYFEEKEVKVSKEGRLFLDENGKPVLKKEEFPQFSLHRFPTGKYADFNPIGCERPLLFAAQFATELALQGKKGGFWDRVFASIFQKHISRKDLKELLEMIRTSLTKISQDHPDLKCWIDGEERGVI